MTIKRRLFISNIMMLVIPVILGVSVMLAAAYTLMSIYGVNPNRPQKDGDLFYEAITTIRELSEKWAGDELPQIIEDIDQFSEKYSGKGISLIISRNGERLYAVGDYTSSPIADTIMKEPGSNYFAINDTGFYTADAGEYKILLADSNHQSFNGIKFYENRGFFSNLQYALIAVAVLIILATNSILTRFVYTGIADSLDILAYGVHQIRDGNLDYRIEYARKDEFAAVCNDFNEMAERLLVMVNARQKDEENRKELIAGISHDLRTPLTSIKTYIEGIELGLASTPQTQKRYFDTIKSKTKDLEHIINQLFLFSKLDTGEFPMLTERLDIGRWLADYVKSVSEEYAGRGLTVSLLENARGVTVNADGVQLGNVITNILENSLKYGNKDGGILRISCVRENGNALIALADNGPGVPVDSLDKLFNVFYRGDKARSNTSQGSGLGLAISAKIIEQLAGAVKAKNLPEGGLCITIALPATGDVHNEKGIDN